MAISLLIKGGLVFDGLGNPGRVADIAIDADRIHSISEPGAEVPPGVAVIDATGLAVSPGFINVLSHAWASLQVDGSGPSDVLQGVTTEVFGEAFSMGPSGPGFTEAMVAWGVPDNIRMDFSRLSEGLTWMEKSGVSVNVASFLGGSNLRMLGAGFENRRMTADELARVCEVVDEEMAEGALGIGTALIYAPGNYADTDELVALCEVVGRYDGLYISHMRSEGDQFLECLEELLTIGARAGCRTEVYHLKAAGTHNHHKMAEAIARIEQAKAAGVDVNANMYPYPAGGTALAAAIPPEFHDGGLDKLAERLTDPEQTAKILAKLAAPSDDFENLFHGADEGRGILFLSNLKDGLETAGRYLPEVAELLGIDDLAEALLEVVRRDYSVGAIYFMMSEDNVRLGLSQPWVSIGSDAPAEVLPVADEESSFSALPTHPRAYGTFSRVLGHYSRDVGLFTLEEAIRKMTSLPAGNLRLKDRGQLISGAFADIAIFDPATVNDTATFDNSHSYATGMRHVIVNGEPVLLDGQITAARPGRRLRRGK